jgi:hypothetical protein
VHDILAVKVINSSEDLFDSLRSILLGELALLADTIEQFPTSSELCNNVVLVLRKRMAVSRSGLQGR